MKVSDFYFRSCVRLGVRLTFAFVCVAMVHHLVVASDRDVACSVEIISPSDKPHYVLMKMVRAWLLGSKICLLRKRFELNLSA
jgi:hypothetical protein